MAGGEERLRAGAAAVQTDGQEHHAGRRLRRRPGHQGRQPDHRRADHRGGLGSAGLRVESRCRSGPVREALMGGFASSRILEVHGDRMIKRTFDPASASRCTRRISTWRCRAQNRLASRCPTRHRRRSSFPPALPMATPDSIIPAWSRRWSRGRPCGGMTCLRCPPSASIPASGPCSGPQRLMRPCRDCRAERPD